MPLEDHRAESAARPSFRRLFDQEFSYVWNTLRRLGVREHDIEDVAHDVFVVVHRRWADYDPDRALRPWLFGISYRVASEYRRLAKHRREVADDEVGETADDKTTGERTLEIREAQRLVTRALAQVELGQRAVFVMHDIDGYTMPEVVSEIGIPLNTAYSRLRLGREQFRKAVESLRKGNGES